MAKTFTLTTAMLMASLCISHALAVPISVDNSRIPPSLPDDKVVRKNFDFLVGLIHNNPKWVTKILVQIKKEMLLRGKMSARSGLKCASCIFQIQYNYSDAADVDLLNDQKGDPHLWKDVLAESDNRPIQQPPRINLFNQTLLRSRRSVASKLRRSNDSQGSNTTPAATSPLPDAPVRNQPSNLTTPRPPRPNSTATTIHTTVATTASSTRTPTTPSRFGKLAEKDSLGRAILRCDEESERTYCQHNGKCLIVKILELKSCSCPTGFRGLRCQDFDVVQTIKTIDRHADIRSFEEIPDEEERAKMISSIAATAYYTVNTFLTE